MSIQVDAKTHKITHRVEEVGLLKLVKPWKLLLVSLWFLMTIHLLKEHNGNTDIITFFSCYLSVYNFSYSFIDFPRRVYTCFCQSFYRENKLLVILKVGPYCVHVSSANIYH